MKSKIVFFLMTVLLTSCGVLWNVAPRPVDNPGKLLNMSVFKASFDSIQKKTDAFVINSPNIQRLMFKDEVYDRGKYRMYKMICNHDTLRFDIVFSGNDTLSRIGVEFYKLSGVSFPSTDAKERKTQIENNRELYNLCQSCYENNFLSPLRKAVENK